MSTWSKKKSSNSCFLTVSFDSPLIQFITWHPRRVGLWSVCPPKLSVRFYYYDAQIKDCNWKEGDQSLAVFIPDFSVTLFVTIMFTLLIDFCILILGMRTKH